jgi:hypothetical protein
MLAVLTRLNGLKNLKVMNLLLMKLMLYIMPE